MRKLLAVVASLALVINVALAQFTPGEVLNASDLNSALAQPNITGGTINGAPIGQFNPKTGNFTTLSATTATFSSVVFSASPTITFPLTINLNAASLPAALTTALLHAGNANGVGSTIVLDAFLSTATPATVAPGFIGRFARGTAASPTAVQLGDILVGFSGGGATPLLSSNVARGEFRVTAAENWTSTNQGAYSSIYSTATGTISKAEVARFVASGATPTVFLNFNAVTSGNASIGVSSGLLAFASPVIVTTGSLANQIRTAQTTPPTCLVGCGSTPTMAGTDTALVVTMGATGSPTSPFVITFNGTWAALPSCHGQMMKAGMVVGKLPIVASPTVTTLTITTNGTTPTNGDIYAVHCLGVQ